MDFDTDYLDLTKECYPVPLDDGSRLVLFHRKTRPDGHVAGPLKARNVFRLRADGSIVWQIEEPQDRSPYGNSFVGLRKLSDDTLEVGTFDGDKYALDSETGTITWKEWTK